MAAETETHILFRNRNVLILLFSILVANVVRNLSSP